MYVLTICDGHNSSVALSQNGEIKFAISEERLTRKKNHFGWPSVSIAHINQKYVPISNVDKVILYREDVADYLAFLLPEHIKRPLHKWLWKKSVSRLSLKLRKLLNNRYLKQKLAAYYAKKLNITAEKIIFLNHHKAHAFAAFSEINISNKSWLHFVIDAEGDGVSTSVSKSTGTNLKLISKCNRHNSLGHFYSQITAFLGMKPNQHEFKVMGLEPYADRDSKGFKSCYEKFSKVMKTENGRIHFKISPATKKFSRYLKSNFVGERFDNVAAAAQVILEDVVIDYVKFWMAHLAIKNVSFSGGVSMNVKLMQRLYELVDIEEFYVVPSSGDESCVIGCSNFGCIIDSLELTKLKNLYLGLERDFDKEVSEIKKSRPDLRIEYYDEIEDVIAKLLYEGKVVARVCGRDEFGARALGNRSILANPHESTVIDVINKQVKNRDFWMPFTPSILNEEQRKLIINPRNYTAHYMNITFNSTDFAQKTIPASLHPWDKTVRPQFVTVEQNPKYHKLISCFYELSGIPGLLNTSFNLHGDPNVSSASDAIHALDRSGLKYLQVGNYLVRK
jgi:carbamoyltransferase